MSNTYPSFVSETVKTNNSDLEINVFPNPTVEIAKVTFTESVEQVQLQLFDAQGRILQQFNNRIETGQTLEINLQQYPAGSYFLAGQLNGKMVQQTLVKL